MEVVGAPAAPGALPAGRSTASIRLRRPAAALEQCARLEQLALNLRAQLVGLAPQRIRFADGVEHAEGIAQPAVLVQRPAPARPTPRTASGSAAAPRPPPSRGSVAAGLSGSQSGRVSAIQATTPAVARPASTPVAIHATSRRSAPVRRSWIRQRMRSARGTTDRAGRTRVGSNRFEPLEQHERLFALRTALDGRGEQRPRGPRIAAIERGRAGLQELVALALPLGDGAARPVDVGLGPRVAAIEKEHPRPDADGELVLSDEIVIEAGEEELFDASVAFALRHFSRFGEVVGPQRVGHRKWCSKRSSR